MIAHLVLLSLLVQDAGPSAGRTREQPRDKPAVAAPAEVPKQAGKPKKAAQLTEAEKAAQAEAQRARRAFTALKPGARKDIADFLALEVEYLGTFQMTLAQWVLAHQDRDPLAWPAETEAPYFDPVRHAPAQPIARHRLAESDGIAVLAREKLGVAHDPRGWRYDWGSGVILHRVQHDTPERAFELALKGLPVSYDLVTALVERAIDDGTQRQAHAAFAHAYTDRSGRVFPGITLYDAWKSGAEIEMPDVDCLGIVNTLFDDWTTWTSVVPGDKQDSLYERIGEAFQPTKRQRELRVAVAAAFLEGAPKLQYGYSVSLDNFHALWDVCASTPAEVAKKLPDAAGWQEFLSGWVAECSRDGEMYQRGVARHATLAADGARITATLMRVLDEYGAFAPAADDATKPKSKSNSPVKPTPQKSTPQKSPLPPAKAANPRSPDER